MSAALYGSPMYGGALALNTATGRLCLAVTPRASHGFAELLMVGTETPDMPDAVLQIGDVNNSEELLKKI